MLIRLLFESARRAGDAGDRFDLHISWFNPLIDDVVRSRPDCCDICRPGVIDALAAVQSTPDCRILEDVLRWDRCACPGRAAEKLAHNDGRTYLERLAEILDRWENTHPRRLELITS
jgi:hypothetical protein